MTNNDIKNLIGSYETLYNGKFWNEGLQESELSANEWGVTDTSNNSTSNRFGNAWQCYGYSLFMAYLISGNKLFYGTVENAANGTALAGGWTIYKSNLTALTLEPGDIIRTGTSGQDGHSAVVWEVLDDGTFTVTECLGDDGCKLNWGNYNGSNNKTAISTVLAAARYIIKAPKTYKIKNAVSSKYLTVMNSSATDGGRVVQLTAESTDRQKWLACPSAENGHIISSLNSELEIKYTSNSDNYARIYENSTSGAVVTIETSGSYYKIKTTKNGTVYYLAADASGSNVYWTSGDSTAYQKWTFTQVS